MANNQNDKASESNESLAERATSLFQGGIDSIRNNPGTAAAVLGGVAAAAAAYVNRDKLVETASGLREKVGGSSSKQSEQA
jgi:hypothetical protein